MKNRNGSDFSQPEEESSMESIPSSGGSESNRAAAAASPTATASASRKLSCRILGQSALENEIAGEPAEDAVVDQQKVDRMTIELKKLEIKMAEPGHVETRMMKSEDESTRIPLPKERGTGGQQPQQQQAQQEPQPQQQQNQAQGQDAAEANAKGNEAEAAAGTGNGNGNAEKKRCDKCGKKLGLTGGFPCRCGGTYCAFHRYSDRHECNFDYREMGASEIRRDNPVVVASKLRKL